MSVRLKAVLGAVAVSVVALVLSSQLLPSAEAATSCAGRHVYPTQNLVAVAQASAAGTTFCIHDGTYEISTPVVVQDRDRFVGVYTDTTRPVVTTTRSPQVFNAGGSDGASIAGLQIRGAIGNNSCEPGCGQGIRGGAHLTVDDAWITRNQNNGIGGVGPGLLVRNSTIDRNGSYSFTLLDGGPSSAAGIKSMEPMTILRSNISNNYWSGVWCDGECGAFTVRNSTIVGNGKAGVQDEISTGPAVIAGNTIQGNGVLGPANHHAGVLISDSANVDVYNNTFGRNVEYGVKVLSGSRGPRVSNVRIHDNTMNGNVMKGCTLAGVSCYSN